MIEGISNLTEAQKELMYQVNELHTKCVGTDYKAGMQIQKVWVDNNNIVCVRLLNGQWYHYTNQRTWY